MTVMTDDSCHLPAIDLCNEVRHEAQILTSTSSIIVLLNYIIYLIYNIIIINSYRGRLLYSIVWLTWFFHLHVVFEFEYISTKDDTVICHHCHRSLFYVLQRGLRRGSYSRSVRHFVCMFLSGHWDWSHHHCCSCRGRWPAAAQHTSIIICSFPYTLLRSCSIPIIPKEQKLYAFSTEMENLVWRQEQRQVVCQ